MNALNQQAITLAEQVVSYCRSKTLSLGGLVDRIQAAGIVTRETADAVINYCQENSLTLGGLVDTLASFSNEVADSGVRSNILAPKSPVGEKVMIAAQDVKVGDTLVTLFNGSHKVTGVYTDEQGITWIGYNAMTPRPHKKGEIVTVIRSA